MVFSIVQSDSKDSYVIYAFSHLVASGIYPFVSWCVGGSKGFAMV